MKQTGPAGVSEVDILRLLEAARDVRMRAYAPYSRYQVGAAVITEDGRLYGGCNVENAAYPLCMCAERVALGAMVAAGGKKPVALAVVTADGGTPCGACRQVLTEFNPDMTVIIAAHHGDTYKVTTAAALLPGYFTLDTEKAAPEGSLPAQPS